MRPTRSALTSCRARSSPTAPPRSSGGTAGRSSPTAPAAGYTPLARADRRVVRRSPLAGGADERLAPRTRSACAARCAGSRNVVAEYPIYDRAEKVLLAAEAALLGAPMDEEGMVVDELHNMLSQYSTPALDLHDPELPQPDRLDDVAGAATARRRARPRTGHGPAAGHVAVRRRRVRADPLRGRARAGAVRPLEPDAASTARRSRPRSLPACASAGSSFRRRSPSELARIASGTYITPSLLSQATVYEFITRGQLRASPRPAEGRAEAPARRDAGGARAAHARRRSGRGPKAGSSSGSSFPGSPDGRAVLERAQGVTALRGDGVRCHVELSASVLQLRSAGRDRRRHRTPRRRARVVSQSRLRVSTRGSRVARCRNCGTSGGTSRVTSSSPHHRHHRRPGCGVGAGPRVRCQGSQAAVSQTIHAFFDAEGNLKFTYLDGSQVAGTIPPGTYQVIYDNFGADDVADDHAFHLFGPGVDFAPAPDVVQSDLQRHVPDERHLHAPGRPPPGDRASHVRRVERRAGSEPSPAPAGPRQRRASTTKPVSNDIVGSDLRSTQAPLPRAR